MPPRKAHQFTIEQTFVDDRHPPITVELVPEAELRPSDIDWIVESVSASHSAVGAHAAYNKAGLLAAVAVATSRHVLVICSIIKSGNRGSQQRPQQSESAASAGRRSLHKLLLGCQDLAIYAFNAHYFVLALHRDMHVSCSNTIDLLTLPPSTRRDIQQTVKATLGPKVRLFSNLYQAYQDDCYDEQEPAQLAQKAWLAYIIGTHDAVKKDIFLIPPINAIDFSKEELDILAEAIQGSTALDLAKPQTSTSTFLHSQTKGNKVTLDQTSYKERVRKNANQRVKVGFKGYVLAGTLSDVTGKKARFNVPGLSGITTPDVTSITVEGKSDPTQAEKLNSLTILLVLQKKMPLIQNPWITRLFPSPSDAHSSATPQENSNLPQSSLDHWAATSPGHPQANSNSDWGDISDDPWSTPSQPDMVSQETDPSTDIPEDSIQENNTWAQTSGDPWSAFASADSPGSTECSQDGWSNFAAASWEPSLPSLLTKPSEAGPQIPDSAAPPKISFSGNLNLSQSQALIHMLDAGNPISIIKGPPGTGKTQVIAAFASSILELSDKTVWITAESNVAVKNIAEKILLAGLPDWKLLIASEFLAGWHEHLYKQFPPQHILTSEQFQMRKGHLKGCRVVLCTRSMLSNERIVKCGFTTDVPLRILVIDEASQIPMSNYIPILSKFEKTLEKLCFIGDDKQLPPFGSEMTQSLDSVFEKPYLLKDHLLLDTQYRMPPPIGTFLSDNVYNSKLVSWADHPVTNKLSCQFIDIHDGREEPDEQKSFKNLKEINATISLAKILTERQKLFKIITPYDAQRNLLEQSLKANDLPWANTCFNVDSFQGNEGEFIIISIVRTRSVGFLHDLRRTNVMLSRAKQGMFICANQNFLVSEDAKYTLLGKMAKEWAEVEGGWITPEHMVEGKLHI